ncbi:GUK1 [Bugula neritina]|uniref:GUK1 n=1 Tax=Bugula neritina TaxID=10212 RepID=A0A7J7ISF8_BUGNE|nr:GUK1 [Bugula neritina]
MCTKFIVIGYLSGFATRCAKRYVSTMPRPVVISGPSGSGKSTFLKRIMKEYPGAFGFSVSHTTRQPRPGEQDAVDYHFVSRPDMEKAIANNEFIETAEYSKNLYGTSEGVKSIKKTTLNPLYIFIEPPSLAALEARLKGRGTETEESLQRRLEIAKREMEYSRLDGAYDYKIVNDDVDIAYDQFRAILKDDAETVSSLQNGS